MECRSGQKGGSRTATRYTFGLCISSAGSIVLKSRQIIELIEGRADYYYYYVLSVVRITSGVANICGGYAGGLLNSITIFNTVLVVQFGVTIMLLLYVTSISLRNSLLNESASDCSSRYLLQTTAWFFLKCHRQAKPSQASQAKPKF